MDTAKDFCSLWLTVVWMKYDKCNIGEVAQEEMYV